MKNTCTSIICRLIRFNGLSASLQLKYLGKNKWMKANVINSMPVILRCTAMFFQYKCPDEGRRPDFMLYIQTCRPKRP